MPNEFGDPTMTPTLCIFYNREGTEEAADLHCSGAVLGFVGFLGVLLGDFVVGYLINRPCVEAGGALVGFGFDGGILEGLFGPCDCLGVLRQPGFLGDKHFVGHLPDFRWVGDGSGERVHHHGLLEEGGIAVDGGFYGEALDGDRGVADGGTTEREVAIDGHVDAVSIDVAGSFDDRVVGEVGDDAVVNSIEMAPVGSPGFQTFDDVATVLLAPLFRLKRVGIVGHPVWKIVLEPVSSLGANSEVTTSFTVDPDAKIDPVLDLFRPLAIPGHIFAEVAVGLSRVVAEPHEHVDPNFLGGGELVVFLESFQKVGRHVLALPLDFGVPSLVVDAHADDVDVFLCQLGLVGKLPPSLQPTFQCVRYLPMAPLNSMTEADGVYSSVLVAGPGEHRHGVGVVEKEAVRGGDFADVFAEIEQDGDAALCIHDASGAEGVADALVDAVFERDVDIGLESFQAPNSDEGHSVVCVGKGSSSVQVGFDFGRDVCRFDIALYQLLYHREVVLVDVVESERGVLEFGDG